MDPSRPSSVGDRYTEVRGDGVIEVLVQAYREIILNVEGVVEHGTMGEIVVCIDDNIRRECPSIRGNPNIIDKWLDAN